MGPNWSAKPITALIYFHFIFLYFLQKRGGGQAPLPKKWVGLQLTTQPQIRFNNQSNESATVPLDLLVHLENRALGPLPALHTLLTLVLLCVVLREDQISRQNIGCMTGWKLGRGACASDHCQEGWRSFLAWNVPANYLRWGTCTGSFGKTMKEMVGGCCVCSDERGWAENPLVYCDGQGCNVAVHQGKAELIMHNYVPRHSDALAFHV